MAKAPRSPDVSTARLSEHPPGVPDDLGQLDIPFDDVDDDTRPARSLGDAVSADAPRAPVSWTPPPSTSMPDDAWDEPGRADRSALAELSHPSWDDFHPDEDRFTFPPPVMNGSSVAPVAMGPGSPPEALPQRRLRWSTLAIALGATLGLSAMVLALYGAASRGGSSLWGWNWTAAPQATAKSFAAQELLSEDASESPPGGLPLTPREVVRKEANRALERIAERVAAACTEPGTTPTTVRMVATFGPDGRLQDSQIETNVEGRTRTTRCVGEVLRKATIVPFEGDPITVSSNVDIP